MPLFYFQGGPGFSANLLREDAALLADRYYDAVRRALGIERATIMGISFGSIVALTYAALFPEATTRCIAIAARAVGADEEGSEGVEEMERMLSRHSGAAWYESARATWDGWTDRVLAATDGAEVDAMMAEILPFYTAHPERPGVRRLIQAWGTEARSDWGQRRRGMAVCGRRSMPGRCWLGSVVRRSCWSGRST